ncbi:MAG: ribose 5-phosphate isomerase B [Clostridia bacterium]|nr:ribose 5-phosphate isomerase B [Clostridia bacterium]MDD7672911.1 ribose 5-phosphate isomerase B [Clostridia bacterium]MDY2930161.1 ribose 5-phosphate isomerase B [Clostridiaceae bacterium]
MKITMGADHGGFSLKETIKQHLEEQGHEVLDLGTYDTASCHYPVYAEKVARAVAAGQAERGILVCGTGIGMSIAANKIPGIRAAAVSDCFTAQATREHNDANILCLGERTVGPGLAMRIVDTYLAAQFQGGRHQTRLDMIAALEKAR